MLGKTFKGLTDAMLGWQTERLRELAVADNGYVVTVRPELVVEIAYDGLQRSSRYPAGVTLRFARVVRYREDKTAGRGGHRGDGARRARRRGVVAAMAGKRSAGLLLYRGTATGVEVLLAHMGGPLWERRDAGAWSVPKGEYVPPEEAWDAARREFEEELGIPPPDGRCRPAGRGPPVERQGGDGRGPSRAISIRAVVPGTFEMEWPRGSGVTGTFPEIDRVAWFPPHEARERLVAGQRVFLERLADRLASGA